MLGLLAALSTAEASELGAYEPAPTGYGVLVGAYETFPTSRSWQVSAGATALAMSVASVGLVAWRLEDPNLPTYPWLTLPVLAVTSASLSSYLVNGQHLGSQTAGALSLLVPASMAGFAAGAVPTLILINGLGPERAPYALATGCVIGSAAFGAVLGWGPTLMAKTRWARTRP